jgi:hypothetical protein
MFKTWKNWDFGFCMKHRVLDTMTRKLTIHVGRSSANGYGIWMFMLRDGWEANYVGFICETKMPFVKVTMGSVTSC